MECSKIILLFISSRAEKEQLVKPRLDEPNGCLAFLFDAAQEREGIQLENEMSLAALFELSSGLELLLVF